MKQLFTCLFILLSVTAFTQDSLTLKGSPVKINSARIIHSKTGGDNHIEIAFTNVSKQKIKNIKFRWTGADSSGQSIDPENRNGDITDLYKPGKQATAKFSTSNAHFEKVRSVVAYEVSFDDGTVWKLTPKQ